MLQITPAVAIDEREIILEYVRASGPGGQNVNKVATAVQLRFDVGRSASLHPDVKERLARLAGNRLSREGVLVIEARRFRTQEQNRADAIARLTELVRRALVAPRIRRASRPSAAARRERLDEKRKRGEIKRARRVRPDAEG